MSEIKGQLLGIILVLVIFGAVSAAVAQIFADSRAKMETEAGSVTSTAEATLKDRALLTFEE